MISKPATLDGAIDKVLDRVQQAQDAPAEPQPTPPAAEPENGPPAKPAQQQPPPPDGFRKRLQRLRQHVARAVAALLQAIDDDKQKKLPFMEDVMENGEEFYAPEESAPTPPIATVEGDDWRDVALDGVLSGYVTEKVVALLAEAELTTVGQLSDYLAKCKLTDLKGIGEQKREQIERALERFWESRAAAGPFTVFPKAEGEKDLEPEPQQVPNPDGEQ